MSYSFGFIARSSRDGFKQINLKEFATQILSWRMIYARVQTRSSDGANKIYWVLFDGLTSNLQL